MATLPLVRIGTRGSDLALWQAHYLQDQLRQQGRASELVIVQTQGDRVQDLSFDKLEGKGFFTKELEQVLLEGAVDVAVHSLKDLPTEQPTGLVLGGLSSRAAAEDQLLVLASAHDPRQAWGLAQGARVGTSSVRRKALLHDLRPDVKSLDLRGNVPTRVAKLRSGQMDAIVLAAAGLERLELPLDDLHVVRLDAREFVPAPAQGVLAYQCREDDDAARRMLAGIHHAPTAVVSNVERSLLRMFEGGCHLPLGAHCSVTAAGYQLVAAYAPSAGAPMRRHRLRYSTHDGLAKAMHEQLLRTQA